MKPGKLLLGAALAGTMALAASKATAFPLYLTSASGTITYTAYYGATADTTANKAQVAAINLKSIMQLVTNEVNVVTGTNPPADVQIAYDPYTFSLYLTNSSGYYYSLGYDSINDFDIYFYEGDIATTFSSSSNGSESESDTTVFGFGVSGYGSDGNFYEFEIYGRGKISFSVNSKGVASMTMSGSGVDSGAWQNSDDGVARGSVSFRGKGTPEWSGPYSIYWWND